MELPVSTTLPSPERKNPVRHDSHSSTQLARPSQPPPAAKHHAAARLQSPARTCCSCGRSAARSTPRSSTAASTRSLELSPERRATGEEILTVPLLFSLLGRVRDGADLPLEYVWKSGSRGTMPSSCQDIRAALAQCLQESDCVMIQRNKPGDCLRPPLLDSMPTKCQQLKKGLGECKRGMVDMRKRFRGNQPITVSKELEGGASEAGQLYAGRPAFAGAVKETEGREPEVRDWREVENEKFRKGL
ncbi:hypothetical protein JHW43_002725 [Diplocarpon mali]|nr:hypothetical protein JHW43_002725 [Diplocarpon mali]